MSGALRFYRGIDIGSAIAFDDLIGSEFTLRHFLSLIYSALISLFSRRPAIPESRVAFFPMHRTKWLQMAPFAEGLEKPPLFILAPWRSQRTVDFNRAIQEAGHNWIYFRPGYPLVFLWHLAANLPAFLRMAIANPALACRRAAQFFELYGMTFGMCRILSRSAAKILITAYEDSYYAGPITLAAKRLGSVTINVMHGNCYLQDQYFDYSLVFGKYHKEYLEKHTRSRTRFIISGSTTIKEKANRPKFGAVRNILFFDQPTAAIYPVSNKVRVFGMLERLLATGRYALSFKTHPAGVDEIMRAFLRDHPEVGRAGESGFLSLEEILAGQGVALTAFSTTGLEAIASGSASLFLNPDGELDSGPLAFMGPFTCKTPEELLQKLDLLASGEAQYYDFLRSQKEVLSEFYDLASFGHREFLRAVGTRLPGP